jgi:DNA-binding GntR family transcriptional regulator
MKSNFCKDGRFYKALDEHRQILDHIIHQRPHEVELAVREHLRDILEHSLAQKGEENDFIISKNY